MFQQTAKQSALEKVVPVSCRIPVQTASALSVQVGFWISTYKYSRRRRRTISGRDECYRLLWNWNSRSSTCCHSIMRMVISTGNMIIANTRTVIQPSIAAGKAIVATTSDAMMTRRVRVVWAVFTSWTLVTFVLPTAELFFLAIVLQKQRRVSFYGVGAFFKLDIQTQQQEFVLGIYNLFLHWCSSHDSVPVFKCNHTCRDDEYALQLRSPF